MSCQKGLPSGAGDSRAKLPGCPSWEMGGQGRPLGEVPSQPHCLLKRKARVTLRSCHHPHVSLFQDTIFFCYFQWKLIKYFQSINNWAFTNKEEKKELTPRISTSLYKLIMIFTKTEPLFGFGSHYIDWPQCEVPQCSSRKMVPSHIAHPTPWKLTIQSLHTTNFKTILSLVKST